MAERAEKRAGMSVPHNAFGKAVRGVSAAALTAAAIDAGYSAAAFWATGDQFGKHELLTDVMSGDFPSVWEQIRSHAVTIVGADGKEQTIYPTPAPEIPTLQVPAEKTPTPVVPTPTPEATSTTTPTATPTETPALAEHDLSPMYTETVETNYMGVRINAELITDESLDPVIRKVTVPEKIYAEFIARTIFKTWWIKGEVRHTGAPTEEDFKNFMALWAKAQQTNDPNDWKQVQLNNIWANDLNDGNGYKQQPYTIWPMYSGTQAPDGVRGINNFAIVIVDGRRVKNITMFRNNEYHEGWGTNLDNENLYIYSTFDSVPSVNSRAYNIARSSWWLNYNSGSTPSGYISPLEKGFYKLLHNGGMTVR